MQLRAHYICLVLVFCGCATLGNESPPDDNLPSTGVGPFRKLSAVEVSGVAPFVMDSKQGLYRDASALALDGSDGNGIATSTRVALYFVAHPKTGAGGDVIVRTRADDARSFYGGGADFGHFPSQVLAADQAWEGANLSGPSVLSVGGTIYLYYAASGGVGLAQSSDGFTFTKQAGPVLVPDSSVSWETTTPHAPSVAVLPSGEFRMIYGAGACIGEASSTDGIHFTRLDSDPSTPSIDPILCPSAAVSADAVEAGAFAPIDTAGVDDPLLLPRVTASGRLQVRVLYTGFNDVPGSVNRTSAIGFAARYGDHGPLVRAPAAIYSVNKHEHAPALFSWATGALLYVTQDESPTSGTVYPAIAAAFAPAQDTLGAPADAADSP